MIFIGNQTAKHAAPVHAPFAYALRQGFNAFEWFADTGTDEAGRVYGFDFSKIDAGGRGRLRALAAAGARFSVHAPWDADPRSPEGAAALRAALVFAADVGAAVVVVHLCRELAEVGDFAAALDAVMEPFPDIMVAAENTVESSPAHCNAFVAAMAGRPGAGRVGIAFDLGHANCCEATRNDYIRFLRELSPEARILHCHVHENWGDRDAHLPLFTGPASQNDAGVKLFLAILRERQFSGSLILEQWPEPPELLENAAARLEKIWRHDGGEAVPRRPAMAEGEIAELLTALFPMDAPADDAPDDKAQDGNVVKEAPGAPSIKEATTASPAPSSPAAPAITTAQAPTASAPVSQEGQAEIAALAAQMAEAMRAHTSWRTRLEWVRDRLAEPGFAATTPALALVAALLRFLATGELPCSEDGGHHRPNHHAAAGAAIEEALERPGVPEWLRRRIYPFLPSHASAYRAAEPLTRIRDIAHRNDIPKEMKLRIKHDLQNKLHRSAGPEDLRTAREIFAQLTAPGASYSAPFVEQFRIFLGELERFFNSPDLGARMDAVAAVCPSLRDVCRETVAKCHDFACPAAEQAAAAVALRRRLAQALREVDGPESRQALRLADIELENLAFARLSAAAGDLDGGARPCDDAWAGLFATALGNAALSESDEPEMAILETEFAAWKQNFDANDRLQAARMRATLLRALRAGAAYQEKIVGTYLPAAAALGQALNIDQRAIAEFAEGAIRAGVMFQPVKLAESGEAWLRQKMGLPPWSAIVPGVVTGRAVDVTTLTELPATLPFPAVVRLAQAAGDEEIPANVRGIVLGHPLPQLSHLAIRARQGGVALAAAESAAEFAALAGAGFKPWGEHGATINDAQMVELRVDVSGVGVRPAAATDPGAAAPAPKHAPAAAAITLTPTPQLLRDAAITRANAGAKAEGAAWLRRQAAASGGAFAAPLAAALPFGSMEKALADAGQAEEYDRAVAALAGLNETELLGRLPAIRAIIENVPVPEEMLTPLLAAAAPGARFAVRSSSNGEDLADLAGAGLYDSVIGVDAAGLAAAVRQVWASLWTRRAALSRAAAHIPQDAVRMAVLVQEALAPDWSFVLHTADPVSGRRGEVSMEIAVGLGETLASANQPGRPYHLTAPENGEPLIVSCADYSFAARAGQNAPALRAGQEGDKQAGGAQASGQAGAGTNLTAERINYADVLLSRDPGALTALAMKLATIGRTLDRAASKALDIEGAVCGETIFIVQARPQIVR